MPSIILASAEGEHALYANTLDAFGNDDTKHRGSVLLVYPQQIFREWSAADASDDMWAHILFARNDTSTNTGTSQTFIKITDSSGAFMCGFRDSFANFEDSLKFRTRWATSKTSGEVNSGTDLFTFTDSTFITVDIRIRISTVTNPNDTLTVDWYVEQQLRETQVMTDATGWNRPRRLYLSALTSTAQTDNVHYQDIIITDGIPTVGMELVTLAPAATGFYGQFTNNYTNIDEPGYDTDDLIYATAAAVRESFIMTTPTFDTSDKIIYAFIFSMVCQTDLGGAVADFQPFLRIAATNYAAASVGADNISPNHYISIWTQNPNTAAAWVQADFDGLEVGVLTV